MALTTGLIAYWDMQGNSTDVTGGGDNGTDTNITYSSANGLIGQGAGFNGSSSNITLANTITQTDFTIAGWIKTSFVGAGSYQTLASWTGSYYLVIQASANNYDVQFGTAGGAINSSRINLNDGNWHQLVVTITGSTSGALYIDGVADGTGTVSPFIGLTMYFGSINNTSNFLTGNLDEIGIWSRALSGAEITQLYNGGAGLTYPFTVATASAPRSFNLLGVGQ